jgi:hypothetical protein
MDLGQTVSLRRADVHPRGVRRCGAVSLANLIGVEPQLAFLPRIECIARIGVRFGA